MGEIAELEGIEAEFVAGLAAVLAEAGPILDERQQRVLARAGARALGRGGIKLLAAATGLSPERIGRAPRS